MAVKINFDSSGMPETPTFILSKRSGEHIGALNNVSNVQQKENMKSFFDFSMCIHKKLNEINCTLWDEISDLRLIYVPEWDKWFQISVEIEEENNCIKKISATSLQEEELSQILLHNIEINTEDDIAKDDYSPTVLYEENNAKASLLNRLLVDKAGHYKIVHVDKSIQKIQRSFSFDNQSINDALKDISDEIHCIFIFGEKKDGNHDIIPRTISAYDLESSCKDCGYRDDFMGATCPKCGSHNIQQGYGEDTTIYISNENLADVINYSTDVGSIKNCFRLESGDDDMTAAIINANPSGTQYLWNVPQYMKNDMSDGLSKKLEDYDKQYLYYQNDHEEYLDSSVVDNYNKLIQKYRVYDETLDTVVTPIKGYTSLMKIYYDAIDFKGYLQNSLMPNTKKSNTSAEQQANLLNIDNLSPVSVENTSYISLATANSTILAYAKVYIDTSKYRLKIKESSLSDTIWIGSFSIISYSDEEDTADTETIRIEINNNYENFVRQKIDKILTKENEDISIIGLFKRNDSDFKNELKKYSLSYLQIIYEACQSCLDILITQGISEAQSDLYNKIYKPYYNKSNFISQEIQLREDEIKIIDASYDSDGKVISDGLSSSIKKISDNISKDLDFKKFIGEYWDEFSSYRREDVWSNTNYISDGLDNKQLFERAKEFLDAAKKDLIKSSTLQHKITINNLKNLLVIKSFEPLVEHFAVGNWLRLCVDDKIYKLRLISYEINYDSLNTISVEFSDVIEFHDMISDIKSVLSQSKSMSSSYDSIKKQASAGEKANKITKGWVSDGLSATATKIMNNADNQEVTFDKHGLLFREYDPDTETYSPIQSKWINSTLAFTINNWETTKAAIGKYIYLDPRDWKYKTGYGVIADTIVGNIILGEEVGIYNKSGNLTFDDNGLTISNGVNSFKVNPNSKSLLSLSHDDNRILYVDEDGALHIDGSGNALDISANDIIKDMQTKITQNAEAIVLKASKEEVGTYIKQNWREVIIGFNTNSQFVQIDADTGAAISIYDGTITGNKLLSRFDKNGNQFFREGTSVGRIGTVQLSENSNVKGLVIGLDYNAGFISIGCKESANSEVLIPKFTYSKSLENYPYVGLWADSELFLNKHRLYPSNNRNMSIYSGAGNIFLEVNGSEENGVYFGYGNGSNTFNSYAAIIPEGIFVFDGGFFMNTNTLFRMNYGSTLLIDNGVTIDVYSQLNMYANAVAHNGYTFVTDSDERLKKNIKQPSINALEKILNLQMFQYDWRANDKHVEMGVIAQQIKEIIPEAVVESKDGIYSVSMETFIPYLIKSIQDLFELMSHNLVSINTDKSKLSFPKKSYIPQNYNEQEIEEAIYKTNPKNNFKNTSFPNNKIKIKNDDSIIVSYPQNKNKKGE